MFRTRHHLRWLIPLCLALLAAVAYPVWFAALGGYLVRADGPAPAEIGVLLAGDGEGYRLTRGAELVRDGVIPKLLISGPGGFYGASESDLALAYARKKGYPAEWFVPFPNRSRSTQEEAQYVIEELHRRGIHRFLIVTSSYHTRRAGRIYHRLAPGDTIRVVAAPHPYFTPDAWWRSREGRKVFVIEWEKTVAAWLGM